MIPRFKGDLHALAAIAMLLPSGSAAQAASAKSSTPGQCTIIEGWDLTGNDLLGSNGKPAPQPCPGGPGDCCEMCATKPENQEPKGKCGAWSFNHGTKTCWMKTQNSTHPNHNGDTSGVLVDTLAQPWPHACKSPAGHSFPPGINQTRCPASQTCCKSSFSASKMGCCPWPNAVCCANSLTCCPSGSKCVDTLPSGWPSWGAVTTCVPTATNSPSLDVPDRAASVQGKCVCKPGPPLAASTTLKNVLVIGDSVSLGYTPVLTKLMAKTALVQHAPWGGDGGAEETAYGLQCVDQWLYSPNGTAFKADLVYFQWGLHDGPKLFNEPPANVTIPGQEGNMSVYRQQLAGITAKLQGYSQRTGAKLLFGLTSPMMADLSADNDVVELNRRASEVMSDAQVPMVDLHTPIVKKCGPVPQKACFGKPGCFSPHCGGTATHIPGTPTQGYFWLAQSVIQPAMEKLLNAQ